MWLETLAPCQALQRAFSPRYQINPLEQFLATDMRGLVNAIHLLSISPLETLMTSRHTVQTKEEI